VKDAFPELPLAAYNVSGEYAMIKAAAQTAGWTNQSHARNPDRHEARRRGFDYYLSRPGCGAVVESMNVIA
jgi:porphobilinogen synthase